MLLHPPNILTKLRATEKVVVSCVVKTESRLTLFGSFCEYIHMQNVGVSTAKEKEREKRKWWNDCVKIDWISFFGE